jgi:hypothetical protein
MLSSYLDAVHEYVVLLINRVGIHFGVPLDEHASEVEPDQEANIG